KQSGDSSLDSAREKHSHHGLELKVRGHTLASSHLSKSAALLRAAPVGSDAGRYGTFELWHRSARELPIGGSIAVAQPGGTTKSFGLVLVPRDEELAPLPKAGISLLDCFKSLPGMSRFIFSH